MVGWSLQRCKRQLHAPQPQAFSLDTLHCMSACFEGVPAMNQNSFLFSSFFINVLHMSVPCHVHQCAHFFCGMCKWIDIVPAASCCHLHSSFGFHGWQGAAKQHNISFNC